MPETSELAAAAEFLHAILARVAAGELTGPARVVARMEGAALALESAARSGFRALG